MRASLSAHVCNSKMKFQTGSLSDSGENHAHSIECRSTHIGAPANKRDQQGSLNMTTHASCLRLPSSVICLRALSVATIVSLLRTTSASAAPIAGSFTEQILAPVGPEAPLELRL